MVGVALRCVVLGVSLQTSEPRELSARVASMVNQFLFFQQKQVRRETGFHRSSLGGSSFPSPPRPPSLAAASPALLCCLQDSKVAWGLLIGGGPRPGARGDEATCCEAPPRSPSPRVYISPVGPPTPGKPCSSAARAESLPPALISSLLGSFGLSLC